MAKRKQPDPDIIHEGTSIKLPAHPKPMGTALAIEVLQRKLEDENTKLDVHETIHHHPHDALVAFNWAMKERYGWASPQPKMTFFGPIQPDMVTVKTGPKDHEVQQVVSGQFKLPNISEPVETHLDFRSNMLHITGQVRKADKDFLVQLVNMARERLRTHSIFRGKAIHLPVDDDGDAIFQRVKFIETDYIKPEELVLNPDELAQVIASLWTPIQRTEECIQHNIPLKRGVLLEGVYGTGKTMTANVTSKVCVDSGWTYILLDDVRALKETLLFAQRYEPCVIFAEDVDRVAADRDQRGNDILNTIDGILSKNSKIITVLTTNHVEKLEKAMLRPGRLDSVISIRPPEPEAVKRLVRLYGRELIDPKDTLDNSAKEMAGNIPATIREIVERSKLAMIGRGDTHVSDGDLVTAAQGMQRHLDLLNKEDVKISDEEAAGKALKKLMGTEVPDFSELENAMGQTRQLVSNAASHISKTGKAIVETTTKSANAIGEKVDRADKKVDAVKKDTEEIKRSF